MTDRYIDWTHVRVNGDRLAAAPYVGEGRKLLGEVFEDAARHGLGVHAMRRQLPDGTVIEAEKHGEIPRITITPVPPGDRPIPVRPPTDFVVWARNAALPAGIDVDYPQQILRPSWTTFFYSGSIEGHDEFEGPKGTYIGALPNGVRRAGNLDWRGRKEERLSWYGPSTRYWYDPFVQMVAQYSTGVFMLGQAVLDTPAYIAASAPDPSFNEQYVLGAGIRGTWLYVVQVQAQNLSVPPPDPADFDDGPYYHFSVGYTPFAIDTVICRYKLIPRADDAPGWRVASRSREVLWSGAIERGINPWFFSPDCSEAITFIPPDVQAYGSSTFVPTVDAATLQKVATLAHDEDPAELPAVTMTDTPVSLAPGGGEAPVAADYLADGTRVEIRVRRRDLGLPDNANGFLSQRFDLLCGGAAVELRDLVREPAAADHWETRRWIMWADAREGVLVTRRQRTHFRDPPGSGDTYVATQVWLEVWDRGVRVLERTDDRTDVTADNNSFGTYIASSTNPNDHQSDNLGQALAPMLPLLGWCWGHSALFTPNVIAGHHAGFCYLPRQPDVVFGWTLIGRVASGTDIPSVRNIYADRVNAPPETQRLDFDGMDVVLGAAARDGIVVLSAYPKGEGAKAADHVVIPAAGAQLPELTGVAPPLERYHPIWLLGEPPRTT